MRFNLDPDPDPVLGFALKLWSNFYMFFSLFKFHCFLIEKISKTRNNTLLLGSKHNEPKKVHNHC
jgi:hypothetical protein